MSDHDQRRGYLGDVDLSIPEHHTAYAACDTCFLQQEVRLDNRRLQGRSDAARCFVVDTLDDVHYLAVEYLRRWLAAQ